MRTLLLTLTVCLFALPVCAQYSGGTGEPNDPYQIATATDLIAFGETPDDYDKHFILTADIDLDPNLPGRRVFNRAVVDSLTGVFDGKGHTISNLTITDGLGLFGLLAAGAQVRDLGVVDANVTGRLMHSGALVAYNAGTVRNCYSSGTVSGKYWTGGLVGTNVGSVTGCYSGGTVSGDLWTGGLVGGNEAGSIIASYSTAVVTGNAWVGGLVGENRAWLEMSYSTGTVSGEQDVGGLVGRGGGRAVACFWDMETSGLSSSPDGVGKTTAEMQMGQTFVSAGWDFTHERFDGTVAMWWIREGQDYPRLWWEKYRTGRGTKDDPYQIATAADLILLGDSPEYYDKHFILTADIDLDPNLPGRKVFDGAVVAPDIDPLRPYLLGVAFYGVFDGNGHTISHLTIAGSRLVGLFGLLGGKAEVKHLGLVDVRILGTDECTGGLAAVNLGTVTRCSATGAVDGDWCVGGLVGKNHGAVSQSYAACFVNGDSHVGGLVGENDYRDDSMVIACYSVGATAAAGNTVGGLVGVNGGAVVNCYSHSAVMGDWNVGGLIGHNGASVTNCYSTGEVTGNTWLGGLIGYENDDARVSVSHCFWDGLTSGQLMSHGGTRLTTAEMQTASTFWDAGWDFVDETENGLDDIWWILEGQDYPRLWWEQGDDASPL